MQINELVQKAHENASNKGFWEDYTDAIQTVGACENSVFENMSKQFVNNAIGNRLMLIVSELGEALEGLRKGDMDNFNEELADVAIRLADLCGGLEINLEYEIMKKMEKNKNRPYKHGKQF